VVKLWNCQRQNTCVLKKWGNSKDYEYLLNLIYIVRRDGII